MTLTPRELVHGESLKIRKQQIVAELKKIEAELEGLFGVAEKAPAEKTAPKPAPRVASKKD